MREWALSEAVTMEIVEGGGHVGFVGRSRAPGYSGRRTGFWDSSKASYR